MPRLPHAADVAHELPAKEGKREKAAECGGHLVQEALPSRSKATEAQKREIPDMAMRDDVPDVTETMQ